MITTEKLPRMLIFFRNIDILTDAYQYVTVTTKQLYGSLEPTVAMFHLITDANIKRSVISSLNDKNSQLKIVFCSSSLSMGMNMAGIEYVLHYGPPTSADAFVQETGRAARESSVHGHSILMTYPRMASGRRLDNTIKAFAQAKSCLRDILLSRFDCSKPIDQIQCCDVCDSTLSCLVKDCILSSFQSSLTESFSDSDDSVASAGQMEEI